MKHFLVALLALASVACCAQYVPQTPYDVQHQDPTWVHLIYAGGDLETVRSAYEDHYKSHPFEKNRHTQYYKRWMRNQAFGAGGDQLLRDYRIEEDYLNARAVARSQNGAWEEMGPWHYDPEVAMEFFVQSPGACHVYTVEQAPSNPDVVYAGTATAGLWKSTDKGLHWELLTRDLVVTSVYAIAVDPADANHVYFGEGSGRIWRSQDGGATWTLTGDAAFQENSYWVRELRFLPGSSTEMIAATNGGLFTSSDQGDNWTSTQSGEFMEIEFHPTDPSIVYAVKLLNNQTRLYKSTDGGLTFSQTGDGWPIAGIDQDQRRCEIAVSSAAPDNVYVLAAGSANEGSGLYGIYLSTDQGENFDFICCGDGPGGVPNTTDNPNTLGWSEFGDGDGGQYYYDLGLDVSPTNPDLMLSAGICVWRSEDTGANWELNAHWVTWAGANTVDRYTHADVHDVKFFETENGVDLWIASDGGLFYSSNQGDNIEPRMYGIHGTDFWGWQAGTKQGDVMLGGTYHNGTLIRNGDLYYWGQDDPEAGGWLGEGAGDNFRGFVNPGDATIGYHDWGSFSFTDDRFVRITGRPFDATKLPNTSYWWGEYGNLEWDPRCYNIIYSPVGDQLYRSTNGGAGFELVHTFDGNLVTSVKVAPRDPNTLYVVCRVSGGNWNIYRTHDGGSTWTDVTPSNSEVGFQNGRPKYLDVDGTDPNRLWFVIVGDHTANKVFTSSDAGDSWTNLTTDAIDNEFTVQLVHQRGSNGGVYLGTNRSVWYRDDAMEDWVYYGQDLPAATSATFMQNNYCEGTVRCAGPRGVHKSPFYAPSAVLASFTADRLELNVGVTCTPEPIRFADNSVVLCSGAIYAWTFEGGIPQSEGGEVVLVDYDTEGVFDVTLTVTDAEGNTDTFTWEDMITVVDQPLPFPLVEDFNDSFPPEHWKLYDPEGGGTWEHGTILGEPDNRVAQFPNYWVDTQGQTDLLILPAQDLSDVDDALLHFDVSHQVYADYIDGLEVLYKTDPDDEWGVLYSKSGTDLAVEDNYVWFWYDEGGELLWRTDTVQLGAFAGEECLTLAFSNLGGYGNHTWIDNVNLHVDGTTSVPTYSSPDQLLLYPNPATDQVTVQFPQAWGTVPFTAHNAQGQLIHTGNLTSGEGWSTQHLPPGIYHLNFTIGRQHLTKRLVHH